MTALRAFIVATALVSFLSSPAFAANEQFLTGLELAIQHFNAKGERELKSWGPEHTYMMKVLEAVEKELPQLKGVTKAGTYGADSKYMSLAFSADTLEVDIASIEEVQALSEALVEGCGYRRETQIAEKFSASHPQVAASLLKPPTSSHRVALESARLLMPMSLADFPSG